MPRIAVALGGLLAALTIAWWAWWPDPHDGPPPRTAAPPAAAAVVGVRTLRLGLNIAADSALHAAAERFAVLVAQRSQGRLRVTVFPDQQLGSDEQMLEQARIGELDLVLTPTAKLSAALPAMQYADLPFFFRSREELYAMMDGEPGRMLLDKLAGIELVGLSFWENGFKHFTANRPLRTPEDFVGLRMRTMKSPLIAAQFNRLGSVPIPVDFHATYQALADGAVDGQENPLVAIVGMRFHEVQQHLTLSSHAWLAYAFSASRRSFESLSPELRLLLQDTARELTLWEREETARREADFLERVHAAGVQVHTFDADARLRFEQALAPVAHQFGFAVGHDLLAKTSELRQHAEDAARAPGASAPWLLGLDTDLSGNAAHSGGAVYRGLQMAVDDINRAGGLLGRRLELVARDNGGKPATGLDNLRHFASHDNLLAVVGGVHTAVISHVLPEVARLRLPYLIPWASGAHLLEGGDAAPWTFRVSMSDRQVAPQLLQRALQAGPRVALLVERSAWGRSAESMLRPALQDLPAGTAEWLWIDPQDPGLAATVRDLLARRPDALVMVLNSQEARTVVQTVAAAEAATRPLLLSHWGVLNGNFFEGVASSLSQVDLRFAQTVLLDQGPGAARRQAFARYYRERYGLAPQAPLPAPAGTLQAYDLAQLVARAVRLAGSGEREAVRAALERLPPYAGLVRDYAPAFEPGRHEALARQPLQLARFGPLGQVVAADD